MEQVIKKEPKEKEPKTWYHPRTLLAGTSLSSSVFLLTPPAPSLPKLELLLIGGVGIGAWSGT
jgi:hypothetical protein